MDLEEIKEEETEEISLDKMSIASLIDYCHVATNQVEIEIDKTLGALNGSIETPLQQPKEKILGIFNKCVDLADKLIKLKEKMIELSSYISSP